jgi:polar amino acid transport system substrate-binding protein
MKKRIILSVFGMMSAAIAAIPASAAETECKRLVVTGHPSYAPVAWAVGDTLQGGAIALVRRLAEDAGVPVKVVNAGSWEAAQANVGSGKADLIVGIYKTAQREKELAFVPRAIALDPSSVLVKAGSALPYKTWDSLIGKKGLISDGESYGPKFDAFSKAKLTLEPVRGFPALLDALQAGKADYALMGYYPALTTAPKDKVAIAVKSFAAEPMYVAFDKDSPCRGLASAFSRGIKRYEADGTIARLWKIGLADFEQAGGR